MNLLNALTVLECLFCRQHCLIPVDAHLNLGKFLYEETPGCALFRCALLDV